MVYNLLFQWIQQRNMHLCIMNLTLIVCVYKDKEALAAIFNSLRFQSMKEFEVIVAQDAATNDFDELIENYQRHFSIQLVQQEDNGFRKNRILNKAIQLSQTDQLVFIDGDCVLHSSFLEAYNKSIKPGRMCMGRRVMTDPKNSQKMRQGKLVTPGFWGMLFRGTSYLEEGLYMPWYNRKWVSEPHLLGCNMGWFKADLVAMNGFDEDYIHPGYGEDCDVEMRGLKMGLSKYPMRFYAIQYHLHHGRPEREEAIVFSKEKFDKKKLDESYRCSNGLVKEEADLSAS